MIKDMVFLQYGVLNWDSHIVFPVEKNPYLLVIRSPENIHRPQKFEFSTNECCFYRSSASMRNAQRPQALLIYQWLADVKKSNVIGWWICVVQVTHAIVLIKLMTTK